MKIDIYTHVMPSKYKNALYKYSDKFATEKSFMERRITDHNERLRILDHYEESIPFLVEI